MSDRRVELVDVVQVGHKFLKPVSADYIVALRVLDEALELCHAAGVLLEEIDAQVLMTQAKTYRKGALTSRFAARKELVDVAITAINALWQRGHNPDKAFQEVLDELQSRQWETKPDGTAQHVEESH